MQESAIYALHLNSILKFHIYFGYCVCACFLFHLFLVEPCGLVATKISETGERNAKNSRVFNMCGRRAQILKHTHTQYMLDYHLSKFLAGRVYIY